MYLPSQMAVPSARFKSILDDALNRYKQKTGKDLPAQWFLTGLESCKSVDAVLAMLQGQSKALEQIIPEDQTLMNRIWVSMDILSTVSATFVEGFSLAFPPAKAIVTGISVLLSVAKGVKASHEALVDLFERIEDFFKRFKIYIQCSSTAELEEVLVRAVAEVLYILSIATKEMEQSTAKKYFMRLLGRTDIEDALRKLDNLIQGEHGMVTAQILKNTSELRGGAWPIDLVRLLAKHGLPRS
ncbi:hypothetical protein H4582DRAFT_1088520 [Lactarius indigo]|nr:hypothetical protein H4582DRAFT_1088520 [Lactarius indigo]